MPIFKLTPACKDYLWGGEKLRTEFGVQADCNPLAEAWVLSCHPDGPSRLPDGTTLPQYLAAHPEVMGENAAGFDQFPLLIKLIDAKDNLSIQVHPSDHYALTYEGQYGKTEMWVVLDAEPGAYLYYGFARPLKREEFVYRIKENTLTEVLNAVPVKKGDVFFIPSGTLHAICKGLVIAEVQQNSNVTYRVYDYGRVGVNGKARDLHINQALDVTQLHPPVKQDFGSYLGKCNYFATDLLENGGAGCADKTSFVSLLITQGIGCLRCAGDAHPVQKGDSLFLPAGSGQYKLEGCCTALRTVVPSR